MKTGISVMDAMTQYPVTIKSGITITECAEVMKTHKVGSLLIIDNQDYIGIITEQDIIYKVIAMHKHPSETLVKDIMSTAFYTIAPDVDIFEALVKMREASIRHLPVVK